jgi:hypothetical protein
MAEVQVPAAAAAEAAAAIGSSSAGRSPDEIALELMKFIAVATGYGKSGQTSAGFSGKPGGRSPEEHAEALFELFERCRRAVRKDV